MKRVCGSCFTPLGDDPDDSVPVEVARNGVWVISMYCWDCFDELEYP